MTNVLVEHPHVSAKELSVVPPSHEEIAERAYQLYEARGGTDGDDLHDWLDAERELLEHAHLHKHTLN
jgi:hypothetical protein